MINSHQRITSGGYLGHLKPFFDATKGIDRWMPPYGYSSFFTSKTNLENHRFHFPNSDPAVIIAKKSLSLHWKYFFYVLNCKMHKKWF